VVLELCLFRDDVTKLSQVLLGLFATSAQFVGGIVELAHHGDDAPRRNFVAELGAGVGEKTFAAARRRLAPGDQNSMRRHDLDERFPTGAPLDHCLRAFDGNTEWLPKGAPLRLRLNGARFQCRKIGLKIANLVSRLVLVDASLALAGD